MKKEKQTQRDDKSVTNLSKEKRAYEKPCILEEEKLETLSLGCTKASPFSCPPQAPTP